MYDITEVARIYDVFRNTEGFKYSRLNFTDDTIFKCDFTLKDRNHIHHLFLCKHR